MGVLEGLLVKNDCELAREWDCMCAWAGLGAGRPVAFMV